MNRQSKYHLFAVLTSLVIVLGCGCNTVIFPETANTNDREGEYVVINMLSETEMSNKYNVQYKAVFGKDVTRAGAFGGDWAAEAGSKLLSAIFDFAVEEAKKGLQEEASFHIANYGTQIAKDDFWQGLVAEKTDDKQSANNLNPKNKLKFSYYGFEIIRYTSKYNQKRPASKLVFGLYPARGSGAMFLVAPLYIEVASVKAKTNDWKLFSFFPLFWYQFALANYSQNINLSAAVTITGVSVDLENKFTEQTLLDKQISLPPVNMEAVNTKGGVIMLVAKSDKEIKELPEKLLEKNAYLKDYERIRLQPQTSCWCLAPSISARKVGDKIYYGQGTFYLKVVVTEEDASECKNYIEKAVEEIDANKGVVKEQILNIYNDAVEKE